MEKSYVDEKNAQVLVALLKEHGIRKVVASPGSTNVAMVACMQHDPYFEMYSSADERSAAYIACGLAAESGEPVVITCTGATSSRNYLPALTEAYYRKLPILAVTSSQAISKVGHHVAQVIDRASIPNDVAKLSVTLPIIKDEDDLWECEIKANQAILELKRHGGGPVHINIPTIYIRTFNTKELPKVRVIDRIFSTDKFPELPQSKVAVFVGAHATWTKEQTEILDKFCSVNDAVVFCDHTSGYKGKYRLLYSLAASQQMIDQAPIIPDILIYIGEISGDYYSMGMIGKQVWRVSDDGEIRDTFRKLRYVFEMPEQSFFEYYSTKGKIAADSYLMTCKNQLAELQNKIPELPFSNIWAASKMAHRLPENSVIHFGILNSLRSWNFFEIPSSVSSASNVGGFGIDGNVSSLVGASLVNKNKLYFGIIGDLAFFYDMNVVGNRHLGKNLRIMVVNNGKGTEFRLVVHPAFKNDNQADEYISAAGHYGNKSATLLKHYAQDLGFEYISATNKDDFDQVYERFLNPNITERPILFEVFTNSLDENNALEAMTNIEENIKGKVKQVAKQVLGENGFNRLKKVMGK
ncbi:thiamine pyrophosphate-binding protein [Dyadobacter sp. MSC1_007]|jgi:2-succinyl-5-enolpyruvyl-6-hydroxy-3-cyclohexene-1-carboxylate synthase|uniref:thiamine pyrophosphate-binding protein n=1 Tax=Dyadobacter sp. MSC1_007 TaxID=2909264 RepID=UPI00202DFE4E|nr:thiamine pyrophosphate-binding protein [Dyadobacter sp. MSC1_007]